MPNQYKSRFSVEPKEKILQEMIRVNHAGESGACAIYRGQLKALKEDKMISEMLEQEKEHLEFFQKELVKRDIRPSLLDPLWQKGGFLMGFITAKLGREAAMACTEAVEEVIGKHYQSQEEELSDEDKYSDSEKDLQKTIKRFKEDELEHYNTAIEQDSISAKFYPALSQMIRIVTKTSIKVAKKV